MTIISYLVLLVNILEQLIFVKLARTVCDFKSSRIRNVGYFLLILTLPVIKPTLKILRGVFPI